MRKLLVSFATGMALILPTISGAVGLGSIKVHTNLNQILSAEIPILSVNNTTRKTLQVSMGSNADFARRGLKKTGALDNVRLNVVHKGGRSFIKVSSTQIVNVPYLNFIVNLKSDEGLVSREYAVFLDPVGGVKGSVSEASGLKKKVTSNQTTWEKTQKSSRRATAGGVAISNARGGKYGPVRRGETLWSIASHTRPSANVSVRSMMRAIIRANRHAFPRGRSTEMPSGVMLNIPTIKGYDAYSGGYAPMPNGASVEPSKPKTVRPKPQVAKVSPKKVDTVKKPKAVADSKPAKSTVDSVVPQKKSEDNKPKLEESSASNENESATSEAEKDTKASVENVNQDLADSGTTDVKPSDSAQVLPEESKSPADETSSSNEMSGDNTKVDSQDDSMAEKPNDDGTKNSISYAASKVSDELELSDVTNPDDTNSADINTPSSDTSNVVDNGVSTTKNDLNSSGTDSSSADTSAPEATETKKEDVASTAKPKKAEPVKPKVSKTVPVKQPAEKDTIISGVPDIATYGGAGLLGVLGIGGGLLLARRKKTSAVGKGVVLTDESDIDAPDLQDSSSEDLLTDDEFTDEEVSLNAEVDDDLLLDLDDDLLADDDLDSMDLGDDLLADDDLGSMDLDDDLLADDDLDSIDLSESDAFDADDEFEIDPFEFDESEELASTDLEESSLDDDLSLDLDLDGDDDLFAEDDIDLSADEDLLTIDDDDFAFDLDEGDELTSDLDSADADLADIDLDTDLSSGKDELDFTTMDDLDGLEDLSLDLDGPEVSVDDEVLGDDFSLDEVQSDTLDFDTDFELDTELDSSLSIDEPEGSTSLEDELDMQLDSELDDALDLELDTSTGGNDFADLEVDLLDSKDDTISDFSTEGTDLEEISLDGQDETLSQSDLSDDDDLSFNPAKAQLKLDLAESFISVDQIDRARNLLQEVVEIGDESQADQAKLMLDDIG